LALSAPSLPLVPLTWVPSFRIIPSVFPPINLFERVADPADLDAVWAVESLTNARLREETGDLGRIAPEDRVAGPGASFIMAPFVRVATPGGRFNTADFGAFYAARQLATALEETKYHRALFLSYTREPPMEIDMRVLQADVSAEMHELRGLASTDPDLARQLYHPTSYSASQELAVQLRGAKSWGIVFDSVRHAGGECVAVLRPSAVKNCKQAQHLAYVWNGASIVHVYEKSSFPHL
jgi:RES domain-containing protein